jgi:hypothetical protein
VINKINLNIMANIFKTTLKKDIIADIVNNKVREVRFPITKFWATRLTNEYDINKRTFTFKDFDSLELSSPSNKDTIGEIITADFIRTFVDGDEFVVEFKDTEDENCTNEDSKSTKMNSIIPEYVSVEKEYAIEPDDNDLGSSDDINFIDFHFNEESEDIQYIDINDVFVVVKQWFEDERILENLYDNDSVFATNARQIIILPKGKILGLNKSLPVNNDVEIRVEFDRDKKIYFDATFDIEEFKEDIFRTLNEIRNNNFVFIWKRYTGIFMDKTGEIYFGIKYSTRKTIGFNRKYSVQ